MRNATGLFSILLFLAVISPLHAADGASRRAAARRDHWAFRPVRRPELPDVQDEAWARNEIDRFVLARLEAEGLRPSGAADPRTLVRRVTFDLIGLPPSSDEVARFLRAPSASAFAQVVDGLLGRPEYGERWARHWLDVARYADTKGYVDAGERVFPFAYTYRDYVIRAFNEDLPFDRFILEQLAADRLSAADKGGSLAALGFLTVGQRFNFFPHEVIDDRIDVTMRGFMAFTVTCARCHDHKYDPISTADYYGLYGVFSSSREPSADEFPPVMAGGLDPDDLRKQIEEKSAALRKRREQLYKQIQREMRSWAADYLVYIVQLMPEHRTQPQPPLRTERGLLREVTAYGRGAVIRWRRYIEDCGSEHPFFGFWNRVVRLPRDEFAPRASETLEELRRQNAIHPLVAKTLAAIPPPLSMVEVARAYGQLLEETESLWRQRLKEDSSAEGFDDAAREEIRSVLYAPGSPPIFTLDESEDFYHLDEHTDVRKHFAEVERVFLKTGKAAPRAMVLVDRPNPGDAPILLRGNPDRPGERVERRFPRLFEDVRSEPFRDGSGRLELAQSIVDPKNPLTARVIVNRVWHWHFGRGLVETTSDFGLRSAPPSHPELLDYLAGWFMENGWSLKKLHRFILGSATWQQRSDDRADLRRVDPDNRLLWRMSRYRLDFESMRDSMLAVAGRLDSRRGGRPVDKAPDDPSGTHRTIYGVVDRERLPGVFRVFDFPSPDISSPKRPTTSVPQQALFLMNSPFVIAQAEALAARLDGLASVDDPSRIVHLYRIVFARDPAPEELDLALRFIARREAARVAAEPARPSAWRYGFGRYDTEKKGLESFTPLPHFSGADWQGGSRWPDEKLQYLRLTATGGHVGVDRAHAAVRRWISPVSGVVEIDGRLRHGEEDCGDGVQAWAVSSRSGELGHWTVYKSEAQTSVGEVAVKVGDTIDFIVDCRENHGCDLFVWAPAIRLREGAPGEVAATGWDAAAEFSASQGDAPVPVANPWVEYAQVLLQSNEFLFVD